MSIVGYVTKYKLPIIYMLIIISVIFAFYAGSEIGKPIGRFIYNLSH